MSVDPGRTIRLLGGGSNRITVDGALRAPGGRIEADIVAPASDVRDNPASRTHNRAIWIGGAATLDVAGRAAGGVDIDGRRYGQAQAGGSILLGGALDWDATGIAESARDIAIVVRRAPCWTPRARAWPSTRHAAAAWGRWTWPATAARSC